MYICLKCEQTFDVPKVYYERHGLDTPPYEMFYESPCCGGEFDEVAYCGGCGGEFGKSKLSWGYCNDCIDEARDELYDDSTCEWGVLV